MHDIHQNHYFPHALQVFFSVEMGVFHRFKAYDKKFLWGDRVVDGEGVTVKDAWRWGGRGGIIK